MKANGQLIACRHRARGGRTIAFVHSLGADQSIWDGVIAALGGGYSTLTYDLRGHGLSGEAEEAYAIADLADDLAVLMERLGIDDAILCGVSVGGMVALDLIARRPDLISAAVICNSAARIGSVERWSDRIAAVEAGGIAPIADEIVASWVAPDFTRAAPEVVALCRNGLCRTPAAGYVACCAAIRDADLGALASEVAVPVLCVAGGEDVSVPPAEVRALSRAIPGARYEELAGVGHLPCLEAPERLAALIEGMDGSAGSRREAGMAVRRSVLGEAHVDRAEAAKTPFDAGFQTLITEGAWGTVWASPGISRRERSMLTLALLAALGNFDEIPMHVRATRATGATARDVAEALQHVAIYAGVPRANHALKLARAVYAEWEDDDD